MSYTYRLLLDELIGNELIYRLDQQGHDVEHVELVPELGKGTDDKEIARYSKKTDRFIVTYDGDFIEEIDETEFRAVLYFEDASMAARDVGTIIENMSQYYPLAEIRGLEKLGNEWL